MVPDPKWLEILKASGWQTTATAAASWAFLYLAKAGIVPPLDPWMIQVTVLLGLISTALSATSIISAAWRFFAVPPRIINWNRRRNDRKAALEYIPHMTPEERQIIAYLLHRNQKMFDADLSGGYAAPLISRGLVVVALGGHQAVNQLNAPMAIPDHVWEIFAANKNKFPYKPVVERGGVEVQPWRTPF